MMVSTVGVPAASKFQLEHIPVRTDSN